MDRGMKTFTLSCSNGYCRLANSRNLNDAINEAKQLRDCVFATVSLYEILDRSSWKLIDKYHTGYNKEN